MKAHQSDLRRKKKKKGSKNIPEATTVEPCYLSEAEKSRERQWSEKWISTEEVMAVSVGPWLFWVEAVKMKEKAATVVVVTSVA
ncbi:unnamed protein product [Arabis nemorensis]|uniref:Uncharacterized protein n=1 Tax=Arabis nemorensis TaxID=586526 RepID=A0A565CH39_9BRAS|nr:unnamed protein product [Arabis nemorensis]